MTMKLSTVQIAGMAVALVAIPLGAYYGSRWMVQTATCRPGNPDYEKSTGACMNSGRTEAKAAKYGDACAALIKQSLLDPNSFEEISRTGYKSGEGVLIRHRALSRAGLRGIHDSDCKTTTGRVEDLYIDDSDARDAM